MLACRIHAKEDLRVENADMPPVGAGEVLLQLGAAGICGSDLHYYFEGRNGNFVVREPLIPGHEASAVVAGVGAGVTRVQRRRQGGGDARRMPADAAKAAAKDASSSARNMKFLGSASLFPHVQGMFQEYFVMGERQCYPVARRHHARRARVRGAARGGAARGQPRRRSARQVGADHRRGTIGCVTVLAARLAGARKVTVSDILDRPLAQARSSAPTRRCTRRATPTRSRSRSSTWPTKSRAASPR